MPSLVHSQAAPATARATRPCASGWLTSGLGPGMLSWMVVSDVLICMLEPGAQAVMKESNHTAETRRMILVISLTPEQFKDNRLFHWNSEVGVKIDGPVSPFVSTR